MKHLRFAKSLALVSAGVCGALAASSLVLATAWAQTADTPKGEMKDGYLIHQSFDLGGHVTGYSGSEAMYDTLVNLRSGPRILNETLDVRATEKARHPWFDTLFADGTGYGGDPESFSLLRVSKGKVYDFRGMFRRDRQYFDYDLLDNPLVPAGLVSNGYTFPQVEDSPHLFNTVRRMTDADLTLFPISKVRIYAGYSQNIMQGPTFGSIHVGTEGLLEQNWRNSTDTWRAGVDWLPLPRTTLSYRETIVHYKGNTNWQLAGLGLQLSNSAPVSLGYDNTSVPSCGNHQVSIVSSTTNPPTANATCNGFLDYTRTSPTRTLYPTEQFRLQSSDIKNVQMNGSVRYTGANTNLADYYESFNGLETMTGTRAYTVTGSANAKRVNVSADYGLVWQFAPRFSLAEQYDFEAFRIPGTDHYLETSYAGTSMLTPPASAGSASTTADTYFLGQKTDVNTLVMRWKAAPRATFSLGYRYRGRAIAQRNPSAYNLTIHQQGALLGADFVPLSSWKIYSNVELAYADGAYVQTSPRQLEHYQVRSDYRVKSWATISAAFDDLERRDNVTYVNHLDHTRSLAVSAELAPDAHVSMDLSYGYFNFFTQTDECYAITPAPANPVTASPACVANGTPYLSNGYYDAPTQYGSVGFNLAPVKRLKAGLGYRMTAINGMTTAINPRQVPGSLQSQYQSPYAHLAWAMSEGWAMRGDWNYYSYGEGTPIGPTMPRSFRGNIYTLGVHYAF